VLCALVVAGCGQTTAVKTVTVSEVVTVERAAPRRRSAPAPRPTSPGPDRFRPCDQNIVAKAGTTTCGFAQNAFYEYWRSGKAPVLAVLSPALGRRLDTICTSNGVTVRCTTDDGGVVRFPERAVDAYTPEMARAFAAAYGLEPPDEAGGDPHAYVPYDDPVDGIDALPEEVHDALEGAEPDWFEEELSPPSVLGEGSLYDRLTRAGVGLSGPAWTGSTGYGGVNRAGFPKNQYVRPHRRSDGTYVRGYWRNSPHDGLPTCKVIDC